MPWYSELFISLIPSNTENFLQYPVQSGFLVFIMGGLALLACYHLFLFFQNRSSVYGLYTLYLFLIILSQNKYIQTGFIDEIFNNIGKLRGYSELYTEAYYIVYFFFAFKFLNIKEDFPKWYRYIRNTLYIIIVYCIITFVIFLITDDFTLYINSYFVFVFNILILSVFLYILFYKSKQLLKKYLIIGSLLLLFFSIASLIIYSLLMSKGLSTGFAYSVLYIGFITENFVFSLGLGMKQKLILKERNEAQNKLIFQMKENEKLEAKFRRKLEEEVELLEAKVERDNLERLTIKYEKDLAELKLASLRSQMNPHFIFNSLNSIKRYIIDNEQENAVFYLNKFSKLVRLILSASMEKDISLAEEIEIAKLYVNIENIRFNNSLQFKMEIDKDLSLSIIKIPALLFQPFLENAIWHGLPMKEGTQKLFFRVQRLEDNLHIQIEDNGIGRERSRAIQKKKLLKRESYGMQLTQERLENFVNFHSKKYSIDIIDLVNSSDEAKGTLVDIIIPIIYSNGLTL